MAKPTQAKEPETKELKEQKEQREKLHLFSQFKRRSPKEGTIYVELTSVLKP